jgi:hypothetical protein
MGLVASTTNPVQLCQNLRRFTGKERIAEHQENSKFLWGGSGEGHVTIKVETHRHRQKDKHKVKR